MQTRRSLLACVLCLALGSAASACDDQNDIGLVRFAPADTDIVVALSDAACLRATNVGRIVTDVARRALGEESLGRSWSALAERLGWSEEEAFDRLLGRRAALVIRRAGGGEEAEGDTEWVILSEVAASTERRLRERLDVSPRTIVGNRSILAVEQGEYEITSQLRDGEVVLLFGPSKRHRLFDEIAPKLGAEVVGAETLHTAMTMLGGEGGASLVAFGRLPADADGWAAAIARQDGDAVQGRFVAASKACGGIALEQVTRWDAASLDDLAPDAYIAGVDLLAMEDARSPGLGELLKAMPMLAVLAGDGLGVSRRMAYVVGPSEDGETVMEAACAVESADPPAIARTMDGVMGSMLAAVGTPGVDFDGVAPEAMRMAYLPPIEHLQMLGLQCGENPKGVPVAWGLRPAAEDAPGWWSIGIGASGARTLLDRLTLLAESGEHGRRWTSVGVARPSAAIARFRQRGIAIGDELALLGSVREVRWAFELLPDGRQGGDFVVRLVDSAPAEVRR